MAQRTEIMDELNALAVHCPPRLMDVEAKALWMRDWCDDLLEFPIEAIRRACRNWRHSGAAKFPTAGTLIPLVRAALPAEKVEKAVEPWREPTDEEYRAMSVREKIRHHLIMAHEAGCKAGPMWRNPPGGSSMARPTAGHVAPAEMPDSYSAWRRQQEHHLDRVRELRHHLRHAVAAE